MDITSSVAAAALSARQEYRESPLAQALEESAEFQDVLKKYDEALRATQRSKEEKKKDAEAAAAKKDREKKINELRAIIAQLKAKLTASGFDPAVSAELSSYETKLFWLLMAI